MIQVFTLSLKLRDIQISTFYDTVGGKRVGKRAEIARGLDFVLHFLVRLCNSLISSDFLSKPRCSAKIYLTYRAVQKAKGKSECNGG